MIIKRPKENLILHFLRVNKEHHGRTCRASHQTHASNQLRHMRKSVSYGRWTNLPINFSMTDTGGSCDPVCHLSKGYDRQTAVDYTVKPARQKPRRNLRIRSGIQQVAVPR